MNGTTYTIEEDRHVLNTIGKYPISQGYKILEKDLNRSVSGIRTHYNHVLRKQFTDFV